MPQTSEPKGKNKSLDLFLKLKGKEIKNMGTFTRYLESSGLETDGPLCHRKTYRINKQSQKHYGESVMCFQIYGVIMLIQYENHPISHFSKMAN